MTIREAERMKEASPCLRWCAVHRGVLMSHLLALLGVALLSLHRPGRLLTVAGGLFVVGILLFSGSLYLLTLSGVGRLGMITPIGGMSFLAGWLCLGLAGWRLRG